MVNDNKEKIREHIFELSMENIFKLYKNIPNLEVSYAESFNLACSLIENNSKELKLKPECFINQDIVFMENFNKQANSLYDKLCQYCYVLGGLGILQKLLLNIKLEKEKIIDFTKLAEKDIFSALEDLKLAYYKLNDYVIMDYEKIANSLDDGFNIIQKHIEDIIQ